MLGEAKSEVKKLGIEKKMSTQEAYMKDNIQKLLATKLQSLGNTFRRKQLVYQSRMRIYL